MIQRFFCALVVAAIAVALVPGAAAAQAENPGGPSNVRVFGGLSFLRFNAPGNGGWGIRPAQVEILVAAFDETLTNFRYSAGIVGTF